MNIKKSIEGRFRYYKFKFFHHPPTTSDFYYNEHDLSIPTSPTIAHKIFPDKMLLVFISCIIIKIVIFLYGIYCYNNGISATTQNVLIGLVDHWWNLEGLSDFSGDYINWHTNWLNGEKLYSDAFNGRYLYPPLFYYMIHIFARWTIFSAPIVMLICNILTGYFVFRLAKNLGASGKAAKMMMVLCLLSPFNLYYSDFIWQNSGIVTTFIVISMFKISQEKYKWGMVWLGVAMSIKQVAFFYYPFFVVGIAYSPSLWKNRPSTPQSKLKIIEYIRNMPIGSLIFYGLIPLEIFLISSYPFIFENPLQYFDILFNNHRESDPNWIWSIFNQIVPVERGDTFIGFLPDLTLNPEHKPYQVNYRTSIAVALAWIGYLLGIPSQITAVFAVIFEMQLFLYLTAVILGFFYWWFLNRTQFSSDQEYYWIMWFVGSLALYVVILFAEIGIYKYYFVSMTPAWAMFGAFSPLDHEHWKKGQEYTLNELSTDPSRLKSQFFGGGSYIHVIVQLILQVTMLFFNKWLAPAFFYLPLFLIGAYMFFWLMFREDLLKNRKYSVQKFFKKFFSFSNRDGANE
ncbi:MAG: hypothetical protein ACTSRK_15300 [Promethearchaeota archaeon]